MEIEDLRHENQYNNEDLFETIRTLEKEVAFSNKVIKIILNENEL